MEKPRINKMKIEEKIDKYLGEAQRFDIGDFIVQKGGSFTTYGQIVDRQKTGGYKAAVFTVYNDTKSMAGKAKFKSTKNWYPAPKMIDKNDIPNKVLKKIQDKSGIE
jgi:hypothetical protein